MNSTKVCALPKRVECKHISEDTKGRVSVPPLYSKREKRKRLSRRLLKTAILTEKIFVALIVTYLFALILKPITYAERGYSAYGGEFFLLFAIFGLVFYALSKEKKVNSK